MRPQQLAFPVDDPAGDEPQAPRPPAADARAPVARHRGDLLAFLAEVTRRVREAETAGAADARARARLRHTVANAQMIAARARRAVDALPVTDLELLRAHGRLLAAARDAHEARRAAEFADGARISSGPRADHASLQLTDIAAQKRDAR